MRPAGEVMCKYPCQFKILLKEYLVRQKRNAKRILCPLFYGYPFQLRSVTLTLIEIDVDLKARSNVQSEYSTMTAAEEE
jgi:hypothetical protein